jgi:hypothetical protein
MPWPDQLAIIREDNTFRYGKDIPPPAEAAALWAEFDAEMNRLSTIMNRGKGPNLASDRQGSKNNTDYTEK